MHVLDDRARRYLATWKLSEESSMAEALELNRNYLVCMDIGKCMRASWFQRLHFSHLARSLLCTYRPANPETQIFGLSDWLPLIWSIWFGRFRKEISKGSEEFWRVLIENPRKSLKTFGNPPPKTSQRFKDFQGFSKTFEDFQELEFPKLSKTFQKHNPTNLQNPKCHKINDLCSNPRQIVFRLQYFVKYFRNRACCLSCLSAPVFSWWSSHPPSTIDVKGTGPEDGSGGSLADFFVWREIKW